jgi:hypothetical protein
MHRVLPFAFGLVPFAYTQNYTVRSLIFEFPFFFPVYDRFIVFEFNR